ncbi:LacI family DNA-binding transcriptional regulator [Nocardia sp. alder85J]|uniref:LacI family DNA-binding transcriptional regulator n=1 Tax=Nocardia sp. alder85J TaxID=2862949 RepID=UPI001CD4ADCF|nr:LacI family DNA-binding transcriptional regulator [Nocardia sp. alder85J]MCX4091094.1 LacI family DNA-binding transcriptional regulator [Nocardia sp. alder85J]
MGDAVRLATIYDVADAAGVSPSTVSRAFSRPGLVSTNTAERIRTVAADLGYRAHSPAGEHRRTRAGTIALVVPDATNPWYASMMRGFEAAATHAGYTTLLADTRESRDTERATIERVLPNVDGIILAGSRMSDRAIRTVAKQRPTVLLNRIASGNHCVVPDTVAGARDAMAHLRSLGHATVTYAGGPEQSWDDGARWRAILRLGPELDLAGTRIGPFPPTVAGGLAAAADIERLRPTAVITYNDLLAIGLLRGLTAAGLSVPAQISVIGFDNVFAGELCHPALTTVATPLRRMGITAFRQLYRLMRGETVSPARHFMVPDTRLIVRESTGPSRTPGTPPR